MPLLCLRGRSREFRFDAGKSATGWKPPALPDDVATRTRAKYIEAFELLVGDAFPWV